ncbi:MAG: hybrid sensor histidine kinase/response regulator [Bryobacteraceae bacterium]
MSVQEAGEAVLVIDDEYAMRLSCQKILTRMGLPVETFEDGSRGLEGVARLRPAAVVLDLKMPGLSGIEVLSRIHEIDPNIVIIVITGYATIDTAVEAMKTGAYDFLPKPFSPEELRIIVRRGLERRHLLLESRRMEVDRALLQRRFVTFVSHQLQSPLAAIHQCLEVLERLEEAPQPATNRKEWLDRCLKRTDQLLDMIRDWLTLAKIEGHVLATQHQRVDLNEVIQGVVDSYGETARGQAVTISTELPADPCETRGDRNCLNVLLDNLVSNAIKYNKPGGRVEVRAAIAAGEIVITVSDTGIGIPERYKPFLFDEFFRAHEKSGAPGTGLGLHIAKRIVNEMGGVIRVESEEGRGSTFRISLPAYRDDHGNESGEPYGSREETHIGCG